MTVRTRFAPSPTGYLHIGGVRTALYCWLYARKHGGQFILRIEDTDRKRSTEAAVGVILEAMEWLGLDADEGPFYQTQRMDRYREVLQRFLAEGHAYHCYCTKEELAERREQQLARKQKPRYDGRCRDRKEPRDGIDPVVRFKNPLNGAVVVNDLIRGRVTFQNDELDDLIIARSDSTPTYNFTVIVDDSDMQITHVIRGDDHLNNTPRQINMLKALGVEPPQYAHVPMILGADGARLSKRHGAVNVLQYRDDGYLPEAVLNYLVRLGWSHGDQEVFTPEELIRLFDIKDVNKSASTFNPEKLLWLNQQYIINSDPAVLLPGFLKQLEALGVDPAEGPAPEEIISAQKERAKTLKEMATNSRFFFEEISSYDEKAVSKNFKPESEEPMRRVREGLAALKDWDATSVHNVIVRTAESMGLKMGKVAQPVRVAVSGGPVSPPIDITLELLGRQTTLARLDKAMRYLAAQSA